MRKDGIPIKLCYILGVYVLTAHLYVLVLNHTPTNKEGQGAEDPPRGTVQFVCDRDVNESSRSLARHSSSSARLC